MAIFASDDFTGVNGQTLEDRGWVRHPVSDANPIVIHNNRARGAAGTGTGRIMHRPENPPSADYSTSVRCVVKDTATAAQTIGARVRLDPVANTCYEFRWRVGTNQYNLYRINAGTVTTLVTNAAAAPETANEERVITCEAIGNSIRGLVNGVEVMAGNDSAHPDRIETAGHAGFFQHGTNTDTDGVDLDDYAADNLGAGGAVTIAPALIPGTSQVFEPVLTEGGAPTIIQPGFIAPTSQVFEPTIPVPPAFHIGGLVERNGQPEPDAKVYLIDTVTDALVTQLSDVNGLYDFLDLIEGREYLIFPAKKDGTTLLYGVPWVFVVPELVV